MYLGFPKNAENPCPSRLNVVGMKVLKARDIFCFMVSLFSFSLFIRRPSRNSWFLS